MRDGRGSAGLCVVNDPCAAWGTVRRQVRAGVRPNTQLGVARDKSMVPLRSSV